MPHFYDEGYDAYTSPYDTYAPAPVFIQQPVRLSLQFKDKTDAISS